MPTSSLAGRPGAISAQPALQAHDGDQPASGQQEARIRALLRAPRAPLPPRQRRLKGGTTSFMLVMHVGAVAALLPGFWSW